MLTEDDIALELKYHQKFCRIYKERKQGKCDLQLPSIPKNKDKQTSNFCSILGIVLHSILFLCVAITKLFHMYKFTEFFARIRIATDKYSYEPVSCGYNMAYTNLGLGRLAQNDVQSSIECLDASWRVHPCAHSVSCGLSRSLVSKLKYFPEASNAVGKYVEMGRKFVFWPDKWADDI